MDDASYSCTFFQLFSKIITYALILLCPAGINLLIEKSCRTFMDYIRKYKSLINSHYVSEGVRITAGVLTPALLMGYFNMLSTGIVLSLGALFVSMTDGPGPIHHRKNGMAVCIVGLFVVTLCAGFLIKSPVSLAVFLFIACFFLSMIGVYGTRAASIGTATMLVLTLTIDPRLNFTSPETIIQHSLLIVSGGLWYMCFSMLLYKIRPYRLPQQALGDYIQAAAVYMSIRSEFYNRNVDYENIYKRAQQQQVTVQQKQNELTELLFKTRSIVKESNNIGRTLVMIYLDVADIFESIMMSHQQYPLLHEYFDETDILTDYYHLIKNLANQLDEVGIAVKSGERSSFHDNLIEEVHNTSKKLDELRHTYLKPDNIEGFISLRRILENIQDLTERFNVLQKYTSYDITLPNQSIKEADYEKLISSQPVTPDLFIDNLTLKSDTFRHSLRVSIAILAGFLVTIFFHVGHSYWILLTIIVILKPAFSLTKKRNGARLAGTVLGVLIGVIILHIVHNNTVLLILLILLMAAGYSFMRIDYFVMVSLMTPYLVLFYHFLNPVNFSVVLKDRITDTIIGSAIAFVASFLFPSWERGKIKPVMIEMITAVKKYFTVIADAFNGKITSPVTQHVARKNAFVALANLSDAFNRMLSEPKSQQKGAEVIHHFVVLSHMFTSYIATLSQYIELGHSTYNAEFVKVAEDIQKYLANTIEVLNGEKATDKTFVYKESLRKLNEQANALLQKRKQELQEGHLETSTRKSLFDLKSIVDQFNLIYNVAADLNKIPQTLQLD